MAKILVACEESQAVTLAFRHLGHDAWSCDLEPCSGGHPEWHFQEDVRPHLTSHWDAILAFPPCTYLCSSGLHWNTRRPERQVLTEEALLFVQDILSAPVPCIALENPVGCISSRVRKPDQKIQPWQFGHPESKNTCLWLKGLPLLEPTEILSLPESGVWENQTPSGQNKLGPSPERAKLRSKTYPGIARAMALQWGPVIERSARSVAI